MTDPYTLDPEPRSSGRALLAAAFAHYCALHWGLDRAEVGRALGGDETLDAPTRRSVADAGSLIGKLLADGAARSFARPFGGGPSVELPDHVWEIDDHLPRFVSSAIAAEAPFDATKTPTHWIFLDTGDFNAILAASCGEALPRPTGAGERVHVTVGGDDTVTVAEGDDRLLRLREVRSLTGMSRSTIYDRVSKKRFPAPVQLGGNMSAWRESEVREWMRAPQ